MFATAETADPTSSVDLDALHHAAWRPMVRLAYLLVDDVALAEDIVQDAFLALYRRSASLRDVEAARGYLRTAVVNGARSTLRKRRTVRTYLRSVRLEHDAPADHDLLVAERDAALHAALEQLPRRQREVVVLRYWEHLSEADIASTLGVAPGTVKSTASRALDALGAAMGSHR